MATVTGSFLSGMSSQRLSSLRTRDMAGDWVPWSVLRGSISLCRSEMRAAACR